MTTTADAPNSEKADFVAKLKAFEGKEAGAPERGPDPVNQAISTEELRALIACLSTVLSELESQVLGLYLDGHSYQDIGERLGCEAKTVDNALQRVKRKIATHLDSRAVPA